MLDRSLGESVKLPAHRPSRRHEIVDAAIRVFARNGFAETSIQDIADEAGVVPTAVYYHFTGKEELFNVALTTVTDELDRVVEAARPEGDQAAALGQIIMAVWEWIEARPDHAHILYSHLPGATKQAQVIRQRFEQQHIERAFVYARQAPPGQRRHKSAAAAHAAAQLSVRTLLNLLMSIHPLRLDGGPLTGRSPRALRTAVIDVSQRIVSIG